VTNAGLVAELGVSRAESVPKLNQRFAAWLAPDAQVRARLRAWRGNCRSSDRSNSVETWAHPKEAMLRVARPIVRGEV
jgi:hypothetical protein